MSDIAPIGRPNPTTLNGSTEHAGRGLEATAVPSRGSDTVELSSAAQYLSQLRELPPVREDLVASIRAQIADGTYETEAKIDAAVEGMADDLS